MKWPGVNMGSLKKHQVKASMHSLDLSKAGSGISLCVECNNEKLGTLKIGHGSMMWRPANARKYKRIEWTKFAKIAEEF